MAQNHLQPNSSLNNKRLLSRHYQTSINTDAGADCITSLMGSSTIANNMPTPNRLTRRAASVDDDAASVGGRVKYQHHQLLPNRLLFGPPSPNFSSDKGGYGYGCVNAAINGANCHRIPFDVDEKRTESATQVRRQVVPQDRSFLNLDNEEDEDATAINTTDAATRFLIFRRSPTTKTTLEQPSQQQQQRKATPVNFLVSSSPIGTFSIPGIRPSLSCPTSVFDSPLLPIGASTNQQRQQHIMPCPSNDSVTDRLNAVDVSVIEYCEDEDDVTPSEDDSGEEIHSTAVINPMRNLSDAFELLVAGEDDTSSKKQQQHPKQPVRDTFTLSSTCDVTFEDKSEKTSSSTCSTSTKPSPTSVFGFDTVDSSSPPAAKKAEAIQLENGITVLRMSLPRFQLHEDLSGVMDQGLIDRVSFYSIVRDINKEAADTAMTDPKGHLYNDKVKLGGGVANNVNAKDGKVHAHPIQSKESNNVLVLACMAGEETWKPSTGAALLDEEWWLLSAMTSRSPEEVALNHASALPSTFSEALGEKDSSTEDSMSSSSKTQLWKPGRSWWEAKSGKNPWVEPVVHNNRWR